MKSQQKRCPKECDTLLLELWKAGEDAFPGMLFNKFHGLFCAGWLFIHRYHIPVQVSKESNESLKHIMDKSMNLLVSMMVTVGQCELISALIQGNLKTDVLGKK